MLQDQHDIQADTHKETIRIADEALSQADQAIRTARRKLVVARRNYAERMTLPARGLIHGQQRSS